MVLLFISSSASHDKVRLGMGRDMYLTEDSSENFYFHASLCLVYFLHSHFPFQKLTSFLMPKILLQLLGVSSLLYFNNWI